MPPVPSATVVDTCLNDWLKNWPTRAVPSSMLAITPSDVVVPFVPLYLFHSASTDADGSLSLLAPSQLNTFGSCMLLCFDTPVYVYCQRDCLCVILRQCCYVYQLFLGT